MTGPDHYAEAEEYLAEANGSELGGHAEYLIARAHVHATLALAAATALSGEYPSAPRDAWHKVTARATS